jgi:DNA-binding transcriptional LysR family regulator
MFSSDTHQEFRTVSGRRAMYDLHRLRLLRELKLRGTLAAVADALSYSPSSVSQQLSQLETEVGVPLLEPAGRRVRLTAQAEILVAHTEVLLQRLELAESDIAVSLATITGELRVASFQSVSLTLVPRALTMMREQNPQLRIHVTHSEPEVAVPGLLARDFDLVFAEEYPDIAAAYPSGADAEPLYADRLRLASTTTEPGSGAPSTARAWRIRDLAALRGLPWIMEPPQVPSRRWAVALCHEAGFEPDVRFESTDLLLHVRMAEQGLAAALVPDLIWAGQQPTVHLIDLPPGRATRRIVTLCRSGASRKPAVAAFRAALKNAIRAISLQNISGPAEPTNYSTNPAR